MSWLQTFLSALKGLFNIVENRQDIKQAELPYKVESIKSESKKDAQKDYHKIEDRDKQRLIAKWEARVMLLDGIKFTRRKQINKDIERIINAGGEIETVQPYQRPNKRGNMQNTVIINCILHGKEENIIV